MRALKLVFLSFMGFCLCQEPDGVPKADSTKTTPNTESVVETPQNIDPHSPEGQIKSYKDSIQFLHNQVYERYWKTEELTCKEVDAVLKSLEKNIESDLNLLMTDVKKHLKQVISPGDKKKRRCIRDIEDELEDNINAGVKSFSKCTKKSASTRQFDLTEMQEKRDQYQQTINNTLKGLDDCLQYDSISSNVHFLHCVNQIIKVNNKNFMTACETYRESKCMAYFQSNTLRCAAEVLDFLNTKKMELAKEIKKCLNYKDLNFVPGNYRENIRNVLSNYIDMYKQWNSDHDWNVLELYTKINGRLEEIAAEKEFGLQTNIKEYLKMYYVSVRKTLKENRSEKLRQCAKDAQEELDKLIEQGSKDFSECTQFYTKEREDSISALNIITNEFNSILPEAGNVALLRCISWGPQNIFGIWDCVGMARKGLYWEFNVFDGKLDNDKAKMTRRYPSVMPNGKTCGDLRKRKLILDADNIMNKATRCLYGASGDYYAVTTPATGRRPAV